MALTLAQGEPDCKREVIMFPISYPGLTPVNTLIQGLTDYPHKSSFYENGKDLAGSPARQSRKIKSADFFVPLKG
jgi:hypothetical protein